MNFDELLNLIKTRRTIRVFNSKLVDKQTILNLLEVARWAPSAHNRQPWRFVVIYKQEIKEKLASKLGEKLRADLTKDNLPKEFIEGKVKSSIKRFTSAPVLLLACLTMKEMDKYPDEKRNQAEKVMAIQSVALALQNILLFAHALGLGVCWRCAPLFAPEIVKEVLNLPDDWEPQAILEIGYYDTVPKTPGRKEIDKIVRWVE